MALLPRRRREVVVHGAVCAVMWPFAITCLVVRSSRGPMCSVTFAVLHATLGHAAWLLGVGSAMAVGRRLDFLCMYERCIARLTAAVTFVTASCALQASASDQLVCAPHRVTLARVHLSGVLLVGAFAVLQAIQLAMCIANFMVRRRAAWQLMAKTERALSFHPVLRDALEAHCRDVRSFTDYWMARGEVDVMAAAEAKATEVYGALVQDVDTSRDSTISRAELTDFARAHNVVDDVEDIWTLLSDGRVISRTRLGQALCNEAMARRRFAHQVVTDDVVIGWVARYMSFVLYSGSAVLIASIWGYEAFGVGIDLLKLYIVALTYLATHARAHIAFVLLMLVHRPFNIGDVLMLGGQTYRVAAVSPGHTALEGATAVSLGNSILTAQPVHNLSKARVTDRMSLGLPLNFDDCVADAVAALCEYARAHPMEIDEEGVRCGWSTVDAASKVLECNWRYHAPIRDRARHNLMRTRIMNHLMGRLNAQVVAKSLVINAAQGGAFNDRIPLL